VTALLDGLILAVIVLVQGAWLILLANLVRLAVT
jgi:hypothetical protein